MFCDCSRGAIADHAVITAVDSHGIGVDGFYVCRLCAADMMTVDGWVRIVCEDGKGNVLATYTPRSVDANVHSAANAPTDYDY